MPDPLGLKDSFGHQVHDSKLQIFKSMICNFSLNYFNRWLACRDFNKNDRHNLFLYLLLQPPQSTVESGSGTRPGDRVASQCPLVSYQVSEEQRTEPGNRRIVVLLIKNLYLQLEGKMGWEVKFPEKIPQSQGFQTL